MILAAVCQLPTDLTPEHEAWRDLKVRLARLRPDLLLLNEMPFGPWVAGDPQYQADVFDRICTLHEQADLSDLGVGIVLGTRPRRNGSLRLNEAYVWTPSHGYQGVHTKQYFPEESGFHESRWFDRGDRHFKLHAVEGLNIGFLICTELMFNEHARAYGRAGADIIAVPRGAEKATVPRWKVALQMTAMVSGAWVLSSNRSGPGPGFDFGGAGFVVDPVGTCLAETTDSVPLVACSIDVEQARRQKQNYPLYVKE